MALSYIEVPGAGTGPYPLQGLEFQEEADLFVEVDDVAVDFTFDARRQEVTLDLPAAAGTTLRIGRSTPIADDDRRVDFLALPTGVGGLTADLLRSDQRQLNFILGESRDFREGGENLSGMGLNLPGEWDAEGLRIEDLEAGADPMDAAVKSQLDSLIAGDNDLPAVTAGENDYVLVVNAGAWAARSPAQGRTHWGMGTVATLNAGVAATNVPQFDTSSPPRYPTASGELIDLTNHAIQLEIAKRALATVVQPLTTTFGGNGLDPSVATWSQNAGSRMNLSVGAWNSRTELNNSSDITQQLAMSAGTWRVRFLIRAGQTSGGANWAFRITDDNDTSGQTIFYDSGLMRIPRQLNAGQQWYAILQDELIFKSASAWSLCFRRAIGVSGGGADFHLTLFFHKISSSAA